MTKDLTLDDLTSGVLAPWFEKPPTADAVCTSPRDAAVRAVLGAVNAHKPGLVRVSAADATLARQCREFVVAFLETDKLKALFSRVSGDTVELKSGVSIQIDSNVAKLSHGAISVIELASAPSSQGATPELKTDKEIARDIAHMFLLEARNEEISPIALKIARLMAPDADPETWLRENFGNRDDGRDAARWAEWKAAQKGLHRGSSLEGFPTSVPVIAREAAPASPIGPDGYYTHEYEQARMERVTQRGGMQQTRPITSKWRRN